MGPARCRPCCFWVAGLGEGFLASVGCFAGVAGDLLSVRATESRQRARRLGGWPYIARCWSYGGGGCRFAWLPVRPSYAPCPVPTSTDYWTNPTLGCWQPANQVIGGTPSAALRALSIAGRAPWHGVHRCARTALAPMTLRTCRACLFAPLSRLRERGGGEGRSFNEVEPSSSDKRLTALDARTWPRLAGLEPESLLALRGVWQLLRLT